MRAPIPACTLALAALAAPGLRGDSPFDPGTGNVRLVQVDGRDAMVYLTSKSNFMSKVIVRRADDDQQVGVLFTVMTDRIRLEKGRQYRLLFPDRAVAYGLGTLATFDYGLAFATDAANALYSCSVHVDAVERTVHPQDAKATGPVKAAQVAQDDRQYGAFLLKLAFQ